MRRYAAPPLTFPQMNVRFLPKGYLGTQSTLKHIQALIQTGSQDFYVRQKAIDILLKTGIQPKEYLSEIKALFEWVQQNIRYTKDPFRVEVLHSARRVMELRAGDCDDMTILLGSMLESIGHPVRLVIIGPDPLQPKLFSHIYLEVFHQGQWIPLDATMPYPMGWEPRALVKRVIPIKRQANTIHQISGWYDIRAMAPPSNAPSPMQPEQIRSQRQPSQSASVVLRPVGKVRPVTLHQMQGLGQTRELQANEQYFLGKDGTLYQMQGSDLSETSQMPSTQQACQCMKE